MAIKNAVFSRLCSRANANLFQSPAQTFGFKSSLCLLGLVIAFQSSFFIRKLNTPWADEVDFNGAVWSQAAHTLLRSNWRENAGLPAPFYFGPMPVPKDEYYVHHPTLLPWLVALFFKIFGEHEWAARLIPIFSSTASTILVWLIVKRSAGDSAAVLSAAIFATMPMELCWGQMVNFEPLALMCSLIGFLGWSVYESTEKPAWRWLMIAGFIGAMLVAWTGYIVVVTGCALLLVFQRKKHGRLALGLLGMGVVLCLLFMVQISFVRNDAMDDLMDSFRWRMGQSSGNENFTLVQWAQKAGDMMLSFIPLSRWFIALAGLLVMWTRRPVSPGLKSMGWMSLCFFLMNFSYVTIFRNASYIHDYATFYFVLPVAFMGGLGLQGLFAACAKIPVRLPETVLISVAIVFLGFLGWRESRDLLLPEYILTVTDAEPPNLIPSLGNFIQKEFSADSDVICNFDLYYAPQLRYYAKRDILNGLMDEDDWQTYIQAEHPKGGIIWMGAPGADEIVASLKPGTTHQVTIEGIPFSIWHPQYIR